MRIAISNLAWDVDEDAQVAALLRRYDIDAIDIAPGKYFAEPHRVKSGELAQVRDRWREYGIEITGMQALLFGTIGLNLFGAASMQAAMLDHLDDICRIGAGLGARWLVFGSPKNRDRGALSDPQAHECAVAFFKRLGDLAGAHGVTICLEPNPACYGANFMTHSADTAHIVSEVSHPAIRMQLDTGALRLNDEEPDQVITHYAHHIAHIHASEPHLVTLGDADAQGTDHAAIAALLRERLPRHVVTIEMLPARHEAHLDAIERSLGIACAHYRTSATQSAIA